MILSLRADFPSTALNERLAALGHSVTVLPMLNIVPLSLEITRSCAADYFIFTSPNAVNFAPTAIRHYLVDSQVLVTGSASAAALAKRGWPCHGYPPSNAFHLEGLLTLLPTTKIKGKRVVVITGENGRPELKQILEQRGALLSLLAVYKRVCPAIDISETLAKLKTVGLSLLIATSQHSLHHLMQLTPSVEHAWLQSVPLLLSSHRLMDYAKQLGFVSIMSLAENATYDALVIALARILDLPPNKLLDYYGGRNSKII